MSLHVGHAPKVAQLTASMVEICPAFNQMWPMAGIEVRSSPKRCARVAASFRFVSRCYCTVLPSCRHLPLPLALAQDHSAEAGQLKTCQF